MLKTRIATAAVLLAIFLSAVFWLPQPFWLCLCVAICIAASWEWGNLVAFENRQRLIFAVAMGLLCGGLGLWAELYGPVNSLAKNLLIPFCIAAVFWLGIAPFWLARKWKLSRALPATLVGLVVLLPPSLALAHLRQFGPWFLLAALAAVWVADTAAYFSGRAFGKHKLAPGISPGKTWEGAIGAAVCVVLFGLSLVFAQRGLSFSALEWIALAVCLVALTALSILGDLFESLLKRQRGIKDSGTLLPGHGGILDRIDSLTSTLPFVGLATILVLNWT